MGREYRVKWVTLNDGTEQFYPQVRINGIIVVLNIIFAWFIFIFLVNLFFSHDERYLNHFGGYFSLWRYVHVNSFANPPRFTRDVIPSLPAFCRVDDAIAVLKKHAEIEMIELNSEREAKRAKAEKRNYKKINQVRYIPVD